MALRYVAGRLATFRSAFIPQESYPANKPVTLQPHCGSMLYSLTVVQLWWLCRLELGNMAWGSPHPRVLVAWLDLYLPIHITGKFPKSGFCVSSVGRGHSPQVRSRRKNAESLKATVNK